MDIFIDFIFKDFILFVAKIFAFFEKYILSFLCSLPNLITRIISYLTVKFEAKNINSQFFIVITWLALILFLASVFYFKTGVIR